MTARFYFTDEMYLLDPKYVPTLAATAFKAGKSDPAILGKRVGNRGAVILPDDQFLVLAGTTGELKRLRAELNTAGINAIGCGQRRDTDTGSPLVTWAARVDVAHPDKKQLHDATVTLVVIFREKLWSGSRHPKAPWRAFPHGMRGLLNLDDDFDEALNDAQQQAKAN
jgi:hypothetical protein